MSQETNNIMSPEAQKTFQTVWCPTIVSFVKWTIDRAIADGKSDIYYLARDGYLMARVARRLVESQGLDIRLHYLKVSRYALRSAQYHIQGETCVDYICTNGIDMTFDKLMKRTGIETSQIDAVAERVGYSNKREEILDYRQIVELRDLLRHDPIFLEAVYALSRKKYRDTICYLRQEGLMENKSIAIVDTGWIGTTQQTLVQLIDSYLGRHPINSKPRIDGYYFGLYELPTGVDKSRYHSFYFAPTGSINRKVHFANSLMEAIVSAPEGMTIGYRWAENEAQYVPIESDYKNPNAKRIELEGEILDEYLKNKLENDGCHKVDKENVGASPKKIHKLMKQFVSHPSIEDVDYWGSYQFCDDILESQIQAVAADITEKDIKNQRLFGKILHLMGLKKDVIHESAWLEGSIVRLGTHIESNLRHARITKRILYIRKSLKSGK